MDKFEDLPEEIRKEIEADSPSPPEKISENMCLKCGSEIKGPDTLLFFRVRIPALLEHEKYYHDEDFGSAVRTLLVKDAAKAFAEFTEKKPRVDVKYDDDIRLMILDNGVEVSWHPAARTKQDKIIGFEQMADMEFLVFLEESISKKGNEIIQMDIRPLDGECEGHGTAISFSDEKMRKEGDYLPITLNKSETKQLIDYLTIIHDNLPEDTQ